MQTDLSYSSIDFRYGSAGVPVWVQCIILVQVALIAKETPSDVRRERLDIEKLDSDTGVSIE